MTDKLCSYCSQGGHTAAHCPRRAPQPSQRRLDAESQFNAIRRRTLVIERKRARKVDPAKLLAWRLDLELINQEMMP